MAPAVLATTSMMSLTECLRVTVCCEHWLGGHHQHAVPLSDNVYLKMVAKVQRTVT